MSAAQGSVSVLMSQELLQHWYSVNMLLTSTTYRELRQKLEMERGTSLVMPSFFFCICVHVIIKSVPVARTRRNERNLVASWKHQLLVLGGRPDGSV